MPTISGRILSRSVLLLGCVLLSGAIAIAQAPGTSKPVNSVFSNLNPPPPGSAAQGAAAVHLNLPTFGMVSTSPDANFSGAGLGRNWRALAGTSGAGGNGHAPWLFTGFGAGLDGRPPGAQQSDIRDHARNYVKQKLLLEILSRSAFGRGLSKFIDPGEAPFGIRDGAGPRIDRSRLLPFISPKLDVGDRKVAVSLIWKF